MTEINNDTNQTPHKRRVRYSGTHPRSYKEKYKELNPEKYGDTIEKVIRKGGTAHLDYCAGNSGFSADSARDAGIGCDAWLWRTYEKNAGAAKRRRTFVCAGCRSDRV